MRKQLPLLGFLLTTSMFLSPVSFAQEAGDQEQGNQPAEATADTAAEPEASSEIVVRGRFIPEPQQVTSQVATFLSLEDLQRTGDDNAALALSRLSGLSVVSGKFAFIRGLGDRYSSALLNGSPLPSPEPLRRTFPLDLLPANVLDGAVVQKTYSPNFPGDFGGGVIGLRTLRDPKEPFANVKVGVGANPVTSLREGIFVRGSDVDFLGYGGRIRNTPGPLQDLLDTQTPLLGLPADQVEAVGESLTNSPLNVIQSGELGLNTEFQVDGGTSIDFGKYTLGLVGLAAYQSTWTTERATRQIVSGGVLGDDLDTLETSLDVVVNGLGSISLGWGDQKISGTGLYIHGGQKQSQIDTGRQFDAQGSTGEVFIERSGFFERELIFGQLTGEHGFGGLQFDWRGSISRSERESPYENFLRRFVNAEGVPLYSVANNSTVRFSTLRDLVYSGGMDLSYTAEYAEGREATFTFGYDYQNTDRLYDFLSLRFAGGNSLPLDVQSARPDFLFSPDNISPDRFVLQEIVTPNDSHQADLIVHGAYLKFDVDLLTYVRATFGVRYENGEQTVTTFDRFGNLGQGAFIAEDYFLPSALVTWNFAEDLQLRLGYSRTIGRPQFREIAQSIYFDPDTERNYRGNAGLVNTELDNYDARLEYYLGRNQFITLAGFYKDITRPIEEVQFESGTFAFETTFLNSPAATAFGAEIEYRTKFSIPLNEWFSQRDWLFSVNYTYTNTDVEAEAGQFIFDPFAGVNRPAEDFGIDGRDLQGASEHIVNSQFGWETDNEQFTLLLGWLDDRVLQRGFTPVGGEGLPDVVEDPGVQLDAVYRRDVNVFGQLFSLGFSGRNLIGWDHEEFQRSSLGRTEFNTYQRGRSFSATVTARF